MWLLLCSACSGAVPSSEPAAPRQVHVEVIVDRGMQHVCFAWNSAGVGEESTRLLEEIARILDRTPQIQRMAVIGHAAQGEADAPKLAQARADAVVNALVARHVGAERIESHAAGATASDDASGDDLNRCIELWIL